MSEPFLAEIKMYGFNFAPRGWSTCDGQILPINQNQSLYSLLGTTYGGDGRTTFGLPDLRSRVPIHPGQNGSSGGRNLGNKGGEENVAITEQTMPQHRHNVNAVEAPANQSTVAGNYFARNGSNLNLFQTGGTPNANMAAAMVGNSGGGQAHNNMQPSLVINFCIALQGLFPSRN